MATALKETGWKKKGKRKGKNPTSNKKHLSEILHKKHGFIPKLKAAKQFFSAGKSFWLLLHFSGHC